MLRQTASAEEVPGDETADDTTALSTDWASYPMLTSNEVTPVDVALIDRPGEPYLGTGETSQCPTGAAIANAVFDAVGPRITQLPLMPDRVKAAMTASRSFWSPPM